MKIEKFEIEDLPSLQAMQPPDWMDVRPHFKHYTQSSTCFPIKVMVEEFVVGVGTSIFHEDTVWLAHIIVHPEHRNRGIGHMLTQTLIERIDNERFKTIYLMATPMGEPVYHKLGFVPETEQLFFKGELLDETNSSHVIPYEDIYKDRILEMDRLVSGENRTNRLMEHVSGSMLFVKDQQLQGYYMPDMGEGMIVALTPEAGLTLMHMRLHSHTAAIVPVDNHEAVKFLYSHGYEVYRKATRMRLGAERIWQAKHVYNRVSGQIG
jgi:hypothetical protein